MFRGRWAYKRQFTIYGHSESTTIACPSTLFLPRLSPHDMDIPGNLTHFHIKEFALSHTQKVRVFGTQKWRHGGHIRDLKQREPWRPERQKQQPEVDVIIFSTSLLWLEKFVQRGIKISWRPGRQRSRCLSSLLVYQDNLMAAMVVYQKILRLDAVKRYKANEYLLLSCPGLSSPFRYF